MTIHVALRMRDGFFAKDGRGWYTSATSRAFGRDWLPSITVRGLLRATYGRTLEDAGDAAMTPAQWVERTRDVRLLAQIPMRTPLGAAPELAHRQWTHPADALLRSPDEDEAASTVHERVEHLDPLPPPKAAGLFTSDETRDADALWRPRFTAPAKPLRPHRWWRETEFAAWLKGEYDVRLPRAHRVGFAPETRDETHVGIDGVTLASRDGILYSQTILETLCRDGAEWLYALKLTLPENAALTGPATIGGDRRLGAFERLEADLFRPSEGLEEAFDRKRPHGVRLVAVSPLHFRNGSLPDGFAADDRGVLRGRLAYQDLAGQRDESPELVLRAAYVDRPEHLSGWNMELRAPRPTRRLCPAGSVYFFERADGGAFDGALARRLWLAAVGMSGDNDGDGLGLVVPGVWTPMKK